MEDVKLPTEEEKLPMEEEKLPTKEEKLPMEQEKLPTEEEKLATEEEKLSMEEEKLPTEEEKLPTEEEKLSMEEEKLSMEEEKLATEEATLKMDLQNDITASTGGVVLVVSISYDEPQLPGVDVLHGTYQDGEDVQKFFSKCKYKVYRHHNISKADFLSHCEELAKYDYPETCRRLVVVFSGHGSDGQIQFSDGEMVLINDIMAMFNSGDAKSPTLAHMARIFFIDTCQGGDEDYGEDVTASTKEEIGCPDDTNMIVAYATTGGYISADCPESGLWLSYLLEELENPEENLLGVLVNVNRRLKNHKTEKRFYQTTEYKSTLNEEIYFMEGANSTLTGAIMGGAIGSATQFLGSVTNKEALGTAVGTGVKATASEAKDAVKQAVIQTATVVFPIGLVVEGARLGYEIRSAYKEKTHGEIDATKFREQIIEMTATSGGKAIGGIGGTLVGGTVGAVVASIVPVGGTAVGGVVGGLTGGMVGGLVGSLVGKGSGKLINSVRRFSSKKAKSLLK